MSNSFSIIVLITCLGSTTTHNYLGPDWFIFFITYHSSFNFHHFSFKNISILYIIVWWVVWVEQVFQFQHSPLCHSLGPTKINYKSGVQNRHQAYPRCLSLSSSCPFHNKTLCPQLQKPTHHSIVSTLSPPIFSSPNPHSASHFLLLTSPPPLHQIPPSS